MKDLKKIHAQLIIKDKIAASRVLSFCSVSSFSDLNYAYLVFTQIQKPTLFTWNTIIRGFSQSSTPQNAILLFIQMLSTSPIEPHNLTYPSVFKAYTHLGLAKEGAQVHARVVKSGLESDIFIRNTLIHMYVNCGFLEEAGKLFDEDEMLEDVVSWNSMIMGYAKSGQIDDSWRLFNKMAIKNHVSWNSMISGSVRNGKWIEALELFKKMQEDNINPSAFTLVSLLNACRNLGAIEQGKWIHEYIKKNKVNMNNIVSTGIIDMYCKCGEVDMAFHVFETTTEKGLSCWNSMMFGLATNGYEDSAIELFSRLESSNLKPDEVSFVCVLTACNHKGFVSEAKNYFKKMEDVYGIEPSIKHYGCLVDILGRTGFTQEAKEVVKNMPMKPDVIIWSCLLSASKNHGDFETAKWAAKHLIEMDSKETSGYVLMSNIYAALGGFEEAIQERNLLKERDVKKQPGGSLIEVNGEVHEFLSSGNNQDMECLHFVIG
ncbi:hypothetical protein Leryth_024385 [Lithospermum erythrorhizon]|nr:hypothetical protein Leryth_024385 [Lithospermum erythrorhizon]